MTTMMTKSNNDNGFWISVSISNKHLIPSASFSFQLIELYVIFILDLIMI